MLIIYYYHQLTLKYQYISPFSNLIICPNNLLTFTDLLGPFQHPCPFSNNITEYRFPSGPSHRPQRLQPKHTETV